MNCAMDHWLPASSSHNRTTSPVWKLQDRLFHLVLNCNVTRNSFLHLEQNSLVICCAPGHIFFQCKSGFSKFAGGGIATLDFMVNILFGEIGIWRSASLMVFTVRSQEFTTASTSTISVLRASSSKLLPCHLIKATNICLANLICCFQLPPIWFAADGFLCHTIQSERLFWTNDFILLWVITWEAFNSSFSPPTTLLPLSDPIVRMLPLPPMSPLKACIKESVSILLKSSSYTALLARQVRWFHIF